MKKKVLLSFILLLLLYGCKTKEEIQQEKEKQRIDDITKEVNKDTEIPDETKQWVIDNKAKTVLTILCLKTSNRCNNLKEKTDELNKSIKTYYIALDELNESIKDIYKKTYELDNYTGYLPYIFIVNNDKLVSTNSNIKDYDELKEYLKENKIVSE